MVRRPDTNGLPAPEQIIVAEPPKFDLDAYVSNYDGPTRLSRLLTIGLSSKVLGLDALRAGVLEAKVGKNVRTYETFVTNLATIAPKDPLSSVDTLWRDTKLKEVAAEAERLEQELKGYKNNLIKESIRMGNEDLGAFYYETGDLQAATKAFARMQEYCTTPKHVAEMALKVALVSLAQENWMNVQSQVFKIRGLTLKPDDSARLEPVLAALLGLVNMTSGQYRAAATSFINVNPSFSTVEPIGGVKIQREILTANDIAVYGGICALASMDRGELKINVLENQSFRYFLELEPHIRRAITSFCNSKYTQCLNILETYQADYLLDVYIQRHVSSLYSAIRQKSIVAYFKPFSRAAVSSMAEAFKVDYETMENELIQMIRGKMLDARLDKVDGVVVATTEDKRSVVLERALRSSAEQERALRIRMWRINMMNHGFVIKPKGKERFRLG